MLSKKYQSAIESSRAFMIKIEDLVREIAIQNSVPYYRIESQMVHYPHMGSEDTYMPVIKIITYFEDTVKQVTDILGNEFDLSNGKSIDKKKNRLDSFSYNSIQYFANLKANRRALTEYKRCGDKKFEIHLCSMLQDAWSGIEKELGYDTAGYPDESKRNFYRVGALLEMVDLEFLRIRSEAGKKYEEQEVDSEDLVEDIQASTSPAIEAPVASNNTPVPETHFISSDDHAAIVPAKEIIPEPVAEKPAPIVREVEQPKPVQEVITPAAPVAEAKPVAATHAINPLLVPKRVRPEADVTPSAGIAPQRVAPPVAEAPAAKPEMKVDSNGSLAVNNPVQNKPTATERFAPEPAQPAKPVQEPLPVVTNVTPITPSFEIPRHEPVVPGIVTPIIENIPVIEPEIIAQKAENIQGSANGMNGAAEKVHDITPLSIEPLERSVPFEEEQKPVTTVSLDENAPITDASLREYVMNSKLLKEVDMRIAERAGAKINQEIDIEGDVERLRFLKVFTLKQLHDRITDNKNDIVAFAEKWIGKDNGGSFDTGISLFYLEYLLVGKKNDPAFAIEYVVKFISDNDYSARYIIPTYNSIRNTDVPNNFSHLTLKA
jgi:hypothetical protein